MKEIRIGDIAAVKGGKRLPKGHLLQEDLTTHPYIRVTDMKIDGLDTSKIQYISDDTYKRISRYTITDQDIYISIAGTIGLTGLVSKQYSGANLTENAAKITELKTDIVNQKYLLYILRSKKYYKKLIELAGGSSQPKLALYKIEDLRVYLPDLPTQQEIASILSTYDDLIEANEKRIKILEEMAQRLYTEWFVKFRFPGHEKVKLVDSHTSFDKIPEGWSVKPISDLATFINGYPFKPSELGLEGLPVVKIPELRSGILDKTPRNTGDNIPQKYHIKNGNILFSWSATLLVNIWNSGDALLNQHLFNVIPKKVIYKTYLFYTLRILVEKLSSQVVGATMQHLRKGVVESGEILLPSEKIINNYDNQASQILENVNNLIIKNQKLAKLRDLLILQLILGKRDVI